MLQGDGDRQDRLRKEVRKDLCANHAPRLSDKLARLLHRSDRLKENAKMVVAA